MLPAVQCTRATLPGPASIEQAVRFRECTALGSLLVASLEGHRQHKKPSEELLI